jgi:gamma-butyrobetaine dioxygenase
MESSADHASVQTLEKLLLVEGTEQYDGEVVSLATHMLQAAALAERSGASDSLIAAALLHDVGHLLPDGGQRHEEAGATWLSTWFPPSVVEPVRLHVAAKRYLCSVDRDYFGRLSPASVASLTVQGGPMSPAEATAFMSQEFATDALAVRRWDEAAKEPSVTPPTFEHFKPLLERLLQST